MVNEEQVKPCFELPAEVFVALMLSKMPAARLKLALLTLQLTLQRPDRNGIPIPLSVFMQLTGYAKSTVSEALESLMEDPGKGKEGVIRQVKQETADHPALYTFNEDFEHWGEYKVDRAKVQALLVEADKTDSMPQPVEQSAVEFAGPNPSIYNTSSVVHHK